MAIKFSMVVDFPVRSRVEGTKKPQRTQRAQRNLSTSKGPSQSLSRLLFQQPSIVPNPRELSVFRNLCAAKGLDPKPLRKK